MSEDKSEIIYGKNPVKEKLKSIVKGKLYIQKDSPRNHFADLTKKANSRNIPIRYLTKTEMNNRFSVVHHQGVILEIDDSYSFVIDEKEFRNHLAEQEYQNIVVLDGVKDVGNLGAILRSCLLFDVDVVILPRDNSAPINEIVVKRSAGAVFQLKVAYVTNLVRILDSLKQEGFWIYGALLDGVSLPEADFSISKKVIVLGDEGKGIRPLVAKNCDFSISIPTNQKLDSLNVSVSTGIILYQFYIAKS
ncbi:MAG: 23S rRNA (guanosine(2251)-2'-O)-methyltransferase RlmB [Spirochaetes bacterium]|nr:23S rRNA (guanosine(2251)-2'-O)-methyltransferase RlmB [Spirochaetota bacterium]